MRRLFVFALLLAPSLAYARGDFDVRPTPSWVETLPIDTNVSQKTSEVRGGIYAILADHQVLNGTDAYYRDVRKVLSSSAVQNASELDFDFDPS